MLTTPGFGSLLLIVSEFRLFCAHELCVSCPRVFPEEDKVKSGVAHILESHPREQHARVGHPLHGSRIQGTKTGKTGPPASNFFLFFSSQMSHMSAMNGMKGMPMSHSMN